MERLCLNGISNAIFNVRENSANMDDDRMDIIAEGRLLAHDYACRGRNAMDKALNKANSATPVLTDSAYKSMNETFQHDHMLYAAKIAAAQTGRKAPENWDEFKRMSQLYYNDSAFFKVLQGIYTDVLTPILPTVYSEAVSLFADVVEVGFGETYAIDVNSGDIPVFQDSAWGAARSVPYNRFYAGSYTLNPQPKTAQIVAKWTQLVGNNMDFGRFFANIMAGLYAKTMAMWNAAMVAASSDNTLIPSGLSYTFDQTNWVTLANKLSAVNGTTVSNLIAYGNMVALSKVLPTEVTGSTNVNMDAAIATMLGADYTRSGYLGEYMAVRLMPLIDAVVPGTQFGNVSTVLDPTKIWMMASNRMKPMVIAYNRDTPLTIEMHADESAAFEVGINVTVALDSVSVFGSRVGLINVT